MNSLEGNMQTESSINDFYDILKKINLQYQSLKPNSNIDETTEGSNKQNTDNNINNNNDLYENEEIEFYKRQIQLEYQDNNKINKYDQYSEDDQRDREGIDMTNLYKNDDALIEQQSLDNNQSNIQNDIQQLQSTEDNQDQEIDYFTSITTNNLKTEEEKEKWIDQVLGINQDDDEDNNDMAVEGNGEIEDNDYFQYKNQFLKEEEDRVNSDKQSRIQGYQKLLNAKHRQVLFLLTESDEEDEDNEKHQINNNNDSNHKSKKDEFLVEEKEEILMNEMKNQMGIQKQSIQKDSQLNQEKEEEFRRDLIQIMGREELEEQKKEQEKYKNLDPNKVQTNFLNILKQLYKSGDVYNSDSMNHFQSQKQEEDDLEAMLNNLSIK